MPQFAVGIDLGTTNSVVAYAPLAADSASVELFAIPQLTDVGTTETRHSLPSFMYLAPEHETGEGAFDLPWAKDRNFVVGDFARRRGAEAPERTVSAAKSWLCHSRVDRRQPILPWDAPAEVNKVSPVKATQTYLEHLAAAWAVKFPEAPLGEQRVVLTVPASFDAAARELTREAALAAGLPSDLVLIEEPQAAVYAWLETSGDAWRKHLSAGDSLFVCDVGGGTTDLSLIEVTEDNGELELRRRAVGNHLLVGGDNMDLALAHHAAERFAEQNVKLNPWQSISLWHSCRAAKEALLGESAPDTHTISVLGRGSRLIGGTVSIELRRENVGDLLTEGFFPRCGFADKPERRRASGFQELGLPFESDTAITRHVAAFLNAHESSAERPPHVLFNGGVFKANVLRQRVLDVFADWRGGESARELAGEHNLDFAVARGAAYYGWAKEHGGVRIRGGVARSYYVGVETAGLAIPGAPRPLRAVCVVPFGMEEGTAVEVPSAEIGLVLDEPAHFRFFSSATRKQDQPGEVLDHWEPEELVETDSLETTLTKEDDLEDTYIPVQFQSQITELGMFELWCASTRSDHRWKLEFSVREDG